MYIQKPPISTVDIDQNEANKMRIRYFELLSILTKNLPPTVLVHGIHAVTSTAIWFLCVNGGCQPIFIKSISESFKLQYRKEKNFDKLLWQTFKDVFIFFYLFIISTYLCHVVCDCSLETSNVKVDFSVLEETPKMKTIW